MILHSTRDGSALDARTRLQNDHQRGIDLFDSSVGSSLDTPVPEGIRPPGPGSRGNRAADSTAVSIVTAVAASMKGWVLVSMEEQVGRSLYVGFMVRPGDAPDAMAAINEGRAARILVDLKCGNTRIVWPTKGGGLRRFFRR